jgi:HAD superfamily hydrolase (TIGR01549 family)
MTLQTNLVHALLFDVDGALSDTDDHMIFRLERFLKPIQWAFNNKTTRPFARWLVMAAESPGKFIYSLSDSLGIDAHLSRIFERINRIKLQRRHPADLFMLVDGVREMLADLYAHYPMAVVSARDELSTRVFLEHFELERFFQVVVTNQTCKHTKPFPDPILCAAEFLKVSAKNCLMIGDTLMDVHAALAARAQSLSVLCGFGTEEELRRAGTHALLPNTAMVKDLLLDGVGSID